MEFSDRGNRDNAKGHFTLNWRIRNDNQNLRNLIASRCAAAGMRVMPTTHAVGEMTRRDAEKLLVTLGIEMQRYADDLISFDPVWTGPIFYTAERFDDDEIGPESREDI